MSKAGREEMRSEREAESLPRTSQAVRRSLDFTLIAWKAPRGF